MHLNLQLVDEAPVFSLAPMSTRMVTAYEDRSGKYHVMTDVLDHQRQTHFNVLASWDGWIDYYTSNDLRTYTHQGPAAARGRWTGDPADSDLDCVGAASPGVLVAEQRVWVYYASRGPRNPQGPFDIHQTQPDNPLALPGRIMVASAPADADGAPCGTFKKHGVAADLKSNGRFLRLDDPCAVVQDGRIWLFFKAIQNGASNDNRVFMAAHTDANTPAGPFEWIDEPVLTVPGGAEMPRVFHDGERWRLLLRRFQPDETIWEHYCATEPTRWQRVQASVFNGAGPTPGKKVTDICPIWTPFRTELPRYCFAAGLDDGTFGDAGRIKQWLYAMQWNDRG